MTLNLYSEVKCVIGINTFYLNLWWQTHVFTAPGQPECVHCQTISIMMIISEGNQVNADNLAASLVSLMTLLIPFILFWCLSCERLTWLVNELSQLSYEWRRCWSVHSQWSHSAGGWVVLAIMLPITSVVDHSVVWTLACASHVLNFTFSTWIQWWWWGWRLMTKHMSWKQ